MGTFASNTETIGANAARDAAINAITATLNGGALRIYAGSVPADADAVLGGATQLAELTLSNPAFGTASSGVATANAISNDTSADASGAPTFFRLLTSGGAVVYQGSAGDGTGELALSDLTGGEIVSGAAVSVGSLTITQSASYT